MTRKTAIYTGLAAFGGVCLLVLILWASGVFTHNRTDSTPATHVPQGTEDPRGL